MGTDKDPEHEDKTGSNPLRQGCPTEEALRRGFSLVYLSRTVRAVLIMLGFDGQGQDAGVERVPKVRQGYLGLSILVLVKGAVSQGVRPWSPIL